MEIFLVELTVANKLTKVHLDGWMLQDQQLLRSIDPLAVAVEPAYCLLVTGGPCLSFPACPINSCSLSDSLMKSEPDSVSSDPVVAEVLRPLDMDLQLDLSLDALSLKCLRLKQ